MLSKIFKLCFNDAASTISTVERFRSSTIIDIPKTRNRTEITQELLAVQDQEEPQNKESSESAESSSDENLNSVAEIDSDSDSVTSYLTAYSSNSSVSSVYFHDKNDQNQNPQNLNPQGQQQILQPGMNLNMNMNMNPQQMQQFYANPNLPNMYQNYQMNQQKNNLQQQNAAKPSNKTTSATFVGQAKMMIKQKHASHNKKTNPNQTAAPNAKL